MDATTALALDLGNKTGYAHLHPNGVVSVATWDLTIKGQSHDPSRFHRLFERVEERYRVDSFTHLLWERPGHQKGYAAYETLFGMEGAMAVWAYSRRVVPCRLVPSEWRKILFGNGRATKVDAIAYARDQKFEVTDDHQAEAICLLRAWQSVPRGEY